MKAEEFSIDSFLDRNHISVSSYNFQDDLDSYIREMRSGLGNSSSLPMLPTYIEETGSLPTGKPVLVLDAGGTNFRAAIVTFREDGEAEISRFRKRGMPGFEREHSREEFFDAIAEFAAELAADVDRIGFCFSYPMVKTSDKDGRLIQFSKEIKAREVEGELIGAGVMEALSRRGISNIKKIIILNDTIATLLAGKAAGGDYDEYIGFIFGTGVNASYNEKNSSITKVPGLPAGGSQLINMEAGSCAALASGRADQIFRDSTARSDAYVFEKMVSGGYLGALWFSVLGTAAEEGAFSNGFCESLDAAMNSGESVSYDSAVLSSLLKDGLLPPALDGRADDSDMERIMVLSRALVSRAAYLASVMVTGILLKTESGKNPERPVCICADGTTFWKLHGLKEQVDRFLEEFTSGLGVYYRIIQIDNAPVIGAAVAGLTNG